MAEASAAPPIALGLDVGGSASRWALAGADGAVFAAGVVAPFSGAMIHSPAGRPHVEAALGELARAVRAAAPGCVLGAVWAGVTGYDAESGPALREAMTAALAAEARRITLLNDVELACRVRFQPGTGCLVYAGTGSIGVFVDASGQCHRVGGRGGLIGDEGSGYWVAKEALARLWRAEDERPGSAAASALGRHLFAAIGGSRWDHTRRVLLDASRGEFAQLALAVARAADDADPAALAVLDEAGAALARLARIVLTRFGAMPVAVAGRAAGLHPRLWSALERALPAGVSAQRFEADFAAAAASRAASGPLPLLP